MGETNRNLVFFIAGLPECWDGAVLFEDQLVWCGRIVDFGFAIIGPLQNVSDILWNFHFIYWCDDACCMHDVTFQHDRRGYVVYRILHGLFVYFEFPGCFAADALCGNGG